MTVPLGPSCRCLPFNLDPPPLPPVKPFYVRRGRLCLSISVKHPPFRKPIEFSLSSCRFRKITIFSLPLSCTLCFDCFPSSQSQNFHRRLPLVPFVSPRNKVIRPPLALFSSLCNFSSSLSPCLSTRTCLSELPPWSRFLVPLRMEGIVSLLNHESPSRSPVLPLSSNGGFGLPDSSPTAETPLFPWGSYCVASSHFLLISTLLPPLQISRVPFCPTSAVPL